MVHHDGASGPTRGAPLGRSLGPCAGPHSLHGGAVKGSRDSVWAVRAWILASCLALATACYSPTQPACGFRCGPNDQCPEDYVCAQDGWCHRTGTPTEQSCGGDAAMDTPPPLDAPPPDADLTSPQVFAITPANGATDVPVTDTVRVQFDEPVTGVTVSTFVLATTSANLSGIVSSIDPYTYMFTPDAALPADSAIEVMLTSAITDGAGNPLAPFTSSFSTAP